MIKAGFVLYYSRGDFVEKKFDIPGFTYFKEKNIYTGSVGNIFNYKILPGEQFSVTVWKGKNCLAKTPENDILAKQEFEFTAEGLCELKEWLDKKHIETMN